MKISMLVLVLSLATVSLSDQIKVACVGNSICLVTIIGSKLKIDRLIYEMLQILSKSLLDKAPIKELLTKCEYKNVKELKIIR